MYKNDYHFFDKARAILNLMQHNIQYLSVNPEPISLYRTKTPLYYNLIAINNNAILLPLTILIKK